jgi:hypothetical protein
MLVAANEIEQTVVLKDNEGIITINGMRRWLPTAAHALQTASHHRSLFRFIPIQKTSMH